jgi:4-amino-4-deoxy-L-arabinose transferase-like glycosyltransferase
MYAYVASHLVRGHTPYVSAWEHKPPGIFFINALGLALAGGTRWGIWLVEFVSLLAAAIAGYFALRRRFGTAAAAGASLIWLAGLSLVLEGGNFTEEFSLPFNFLALLLFGLTIKRFPSPLLHAALGLTMGCTLHAAPEQRRRDSPSC